MYKKGLEPKINKGKKQQTVHYQEESKGGKQRPRQKQKRKIKSFHQTKGQGGISFMRRLQKGTTD
jgi:hypothetical protein